MYAKGPLKPALLPLRPRLFNHRPQFVPGILNLLCQVFKEFDLPVLQYGWYWSLSLWVRDRNWARDPVYERCLLSSPVGQERLSDFTSFWKHPGCCICHRARCFLSPELQLCSVSTLLVTSSTCLPMNSRASVTLFTFNCCLKWLQPPERFFLHLFNSFHYRKQSLDTGWWSFSSLARVLDFFAGLGFGVSGNGSKLGSAWFCKTSNSNLSSRDFLA